MRRSYRLVSLLAVPLLLALAVAGARAGSHSQAAMALVKTAPAHILVNAKGMTLYVYSKDTKGKSTCTGACAKFWPAVMVPKGTMPPAHMAGIVGTFGEIMLAGGGGQLTFDGVPLYTFANDKKPGDMYGQGVINSWWIVVAPSAM